VEGAEAATVGGAEVAGAAPEVGAAPGASARIPSTEGGVGGAAVDAAIEATAPLDAGSVLSNPSSLWGRSAEEIAQAFLDAGYEATIRQSTRGSKRAQIVELAGHKEIRQIQVHPGGGRHGGAYIKVSTTRQGIVKVVDPETYRSLPNERSTIVKGSKESE
jgi:hypothetical protein